MAARGCTLLHMTSHNSFWFSTSSICLLYSSTQILVVNWSISEKADQCEVCQLQYELKCIEKEDWTISWFLDRIQQITDILESIGDPISHSDQLETVLDGLSSEYQAITMIIHYHDDPCPMTVYVTMLLSHEIRLDRANQIPITEPHGNGQGLPITSIIPTTFQSSLKP